MIPKNILEKSWLMFEADATKGGVEASEIDFMMGASVILGVITGRFDIGIPANTAPGDLLIHLLEELSEMRPRLAKLEAQARDRTARMNKLRAH